ncbi:MAG: hypothetical protein CM15mL4_1280 [uncultured marine virus]|nr:MAG: hypothetical protein CM15mL4_1280 [uncultured marine virus]
MALTKLTDLQPLHVHSIGISTFDGSVSVGGTLTYEDVTNVDAIGVVTARTGIKVLGGGANVVGVVTATAFHGDGSNLTGISGVSIANQADNRLITATGTTDALNAESTLTYNAGAFLQTKTGSNPTITLSRNESVGDEQAIGTLNFANNTANTINARVAAYSDGTGNVGGHLYFETRDPSNSTLSERVRIKSNGYVGIGTENPQRPLAVTSGTSGVTAEFNIPDNNPTGSGAGLSLNIVNRSNSGYAPLAMNAKVYAFGLSGVEKIRIDNNGNLCVGITGGSAKFHTKGDQSGGLIKCDAAEGTVRFFLTGNDSNACELNMYNERAGVQSTIIKKSWSIK